jgi:hypothetical protein
MDWEGIDPPEAAPGFFHIGIWTDVPAGSDQPFSHPGVMLHEWVAPRAMLNERPVACDFHPAYMADPDGCFRYDFVVPEGQWFYQEGAGNIYWLSISAMYAGSDCECNGDISGDGTIDIVDVIAVMAQVGCPVGTGNPECDAADVDCDGDVDQHDVSVIECQFGVWPPEPLCCSLPGDHAWGWKTREHFYSDDAVRIFEPFAPVPGSEYTLGEPIEDPSGASWDMAFVLTTLRTTCPADISGDGIVDAFDLALLLGAWGPCPAPCMPGDPEQTCSEDLSGDCMVGAFDLATLLGAWGPCCGDGLCRPEELCGLPYECELDCGPCP